MLITQKCQYALQSLLILARHAKVKSRPLKIAQIAEEHGIPFRFLEVILHQLKQGGFVESKRGAEGGYYLAVAPESLSVGEIISFVDGPFYSEKNDDGHAHGNGNGNGSHAASASSEVFRALWVQADAALFSLFDKITLANLLEQETRTHAVKSPSYEI